MASGEWRVASGEWRVASGEWRVASGEWRVASGEWQVARTVRGMAGGEVLITSTDSFSFRLKKNNVSVG